MPSMFKSLVAGLLLAAAGLAVPVQASTVYDFQSDYSTTSNPNGAWEYRYANIGAANSTSALMTEHFSGDANDWNFGPGDQFSIVSTDVVHPGQDHDSIVEFAPALAGSELLHVSASDLYHATGNGVVASFWLNDTLIVSKTMTTEGESLSYTADILFNPGDKFYVRVNRGDQNLNGNSTVVNATFTAVPEPASLALLGLGAIGLLAVARRRRAA